MSDRVRLFFRRHPLLRDAVLWAVPALVVGAVLRLLLLSYLPYAYWGSDSRSYYSFVHQLLDEGNVSLDEKRRYLYPIFLLPVSLLPGAPLRWLAWIQHGLGLATLIPLAYVVRRTLAHWRWWVVPVTVAWAGMPMVVWYEHEMLGETLFFGTIVWAIAGWCAWVKEARVERAQQLFWWFFVPLALFLLTKPSGRFVLPGVCLGLVLVMAWRRLARRHWIALGLLFAVTLTMGSKKQGAWLLYVATFPLTVLDSPKHAEYKAEIRDFVEPLQREIDTYYLRDDEPFGFLENPGKQDARPLWKALDRDINLRTRIYMDLAVEGVRARPDWFLYLAVQRVVASSCFSEFKNSRFEPDYYPDRFRDDYENAAKSLAKGRNTSPLTAFALRAPLPPWEEFRARLAPRPIAIAPAVVLGWMSGYERVMDPVRLPKSKDFAERSIGRARPTFVGILLVLGAVLSLLPRYRSTLGVWMLIGVSYLFGVFLVSQPNPRYFGPAWAMLLPLLAVPMDVLWQALRPSSPRA